MSKNIFRLLKNMSSHSKIFGVTQKYFPRSVRRTKGQVATVSGFRVCRLGLGPSRTRQAY